MVNAGKKNDVLLKYYPLIMMGIVTLVAVLGFALSFSSTGFSQRYPSSSFTPADNNILSASANLGGKAAGMIAVPANSPVAWGAPEDIPVPADYNGDKFTEMAVFRPSNGNWYTYKGATTSWGMKGDIPIPADYNGDGKTEIAVFRPSNGNWYTYKGATTSWGMKGDIPIPADYNGDGKTEIAVFRPSNGNWYRYNSTAVPWGMTGDIPVPADYNGDKIAEMAVFRPSNGNWYTYKGATTSWGMKGDIPVPADYNGDGIADIAVWRPSDGNWYIKYASGNTLTIHWGQTGDVPVPRDYNNDRKAEIAVWRPSNGNWYFYTPATCGDGIRNQLSEDCDGIDLAGAACTTFGFIGGTLKCTSSCLFDKSQCNANKTATFCTDSDGGVNPYVKGQCTDSRGTFYDGCLSADGAGPSAEGAYVHESFCLTDEMVQYCKNFNDAAYCDNLPRDCYQSPLIPAANLAWSYFPRDEKLFCPNGCKDGACIPSNNNTSCTDTDGGINYYVAGELDLQNVPQPGYHTQSTDYCVNITTLREVYCNSAGSVGGIPGYSEVFYNCPNGCSNGTCNANKTAITCTDSDKGINNFVKGYVSTNYNNQDPSKYAYDSCMIPDSNYPNQKVGVNACYGIDCYIEEFYCQGTAGPYALISNCQNGCLDGACLSQSCTDSDSGRNFYVKGSGSGGEYAGASFPVICGANNDPACYPRTDGIPFSTFYDVCVNSQQLGEAFCDNTGKLNSASWQCLNGCSNGACLLNSTNLPNLVVSDFTYAVTDSQAFPDMKQLGVTVHVVNIGNARSEGDFTIMLHVTPSAYYPEYGFTMGAPMFQQAELPILYSGQGKDVLMNSYLIPRNASVNVSITVTADKYPDDGTHLDDDGSNAIRESNENDNSLTKPFTYNP